MPEGNIVCSVNGELQTETRSRRPIRITQSVKQATSETLEVLGGPMTTNHDPPSMPDKLNRRGRQMSSRESDNCIVPLKREDRSRRMKPGNAGVGKAVGPTRFWCHASSAHRGRIAMLT